MIAGAIGEIKINNGWHQLRGWFSAPQVVTQVSCANRAIRANRQADASAYAGVALWLSGAPRSPVCLGPNGLQNQTSFRWIASGPDPMPTVCVAYHSRAVQVVCNRYSTYSTKFLIVNHKQ